MPTSTATSRPDLRPAWPTLFAVCRTRIARGAVFLSLVLALASVTLGQGPTTAPSTDTNAVAPAESRVLVANALNFLRSEQSPEGGFAAEQPHLATALGLLAFCSAGELNEEDQGRVAKAVDYLLRTASPNGDLGDNVFRTESHALATAALLAGGARVKDPALAARAAAAGEAAVRQLQRVQDRGGAVGTRGGWKMEAGEGRENDRRASTWALWSLASARLYGLETRKSDLDRASRFVAASIKETAERTDEIGGLSVDAEGLAVASASAMGGWVLATQRPGSAPAKLNLAWLTRHPPQWTGPTYFHTGFFHLRAVKLADASGKVFADHHRRVFLQLREHQFGDGSVSFPPGEAQNFVAMGRVFSTSMAILLIHAGDSRLVVDEDYRAALGF
ncbi:MAG: hypothetical protein NTW19_11315 [Planctomycetota bacterium]|nr:hypothetical protein [Planctomycetota bacterium]